MSEAIAIQRPPIALPWRLLRLLPGVALLFALGYAGKVTEAVLRDYGKAHHLALPNIEYVLWAIVFGLVIANTVGVAQVFRPGIATYDFWLKAGIVLLGARFLLGDVLQLGRISLALVGIELAVAIGIMTLLGRWFRLKPKLTSLLAIGSSICGVSATRNAMIGFVVLGYAIYWASRGQAHTVGNKAAFVWQKFPKFVLGFLFVSLFATFGAFDKGQIASLANLSRWAFLLTFAGVGLKTDFREIKRQGLRPFVVGALAELTITVVTLGLVLGAATVFDL